MRDMLLWKSGDRLKLFFMHIPKTAGTSVADVLGAIAGDEGFRRDIGGTDRALWGDMGRYAIVTGHLFLAEVRAQSWGSSVPLATVLRSPVERLASHLRFMDRYNYDEFRPIYETWPDYVQSATDRIGALDFTSADDISRYLSNLSSWETLTFDNPQVRYLVDNPGADLSAHQRALHEADVDEALQRLLEFEIVGRAENLDKFLDEVTQFLGADPPETVPRSNPSMCRRAINTGDSAIRAAMAPAVRFDQTLYDAFNMRDTTARQAF